MPDNNHIHHILLKKYNSINKTLFTITLISLVLNFIGLIIFHLIGSFVSLISYVFLFVLYFFCLNKFKYKY